MADARVIETDLISGRTYEWSEKTVDQTDWMTTLFKAYLGDCPSLEWHCEWHPKFGWVPEACCPVHDPDG